MTPAPLPTQLGQLGELLGTMCAEAAAALQNATAALLQNRERLAHQVDHRASRRSQARRAQAEEIAGDALLFHQPVAGDLRAVVSAIRTSGDIERMGALARHVAQVAAAGTHAARRGAAATSPRWGRSRWGWDTRRPRWCAPATCCWPCELDADDDAMDALHRHMFEVLMAPDWPHGIPAAVDVTLLARFYERFADHAVTVAHSTVYAVTGRSRTPSRSERPISRSGRTRSPRWPSPSAARRSSWCRPSRSGGPACRCPRC